MKTIVECVPNFSEGRNNATIQAISGAIQSVDNVKLLNVDPGEDFNRTVYTFVGTPNGVLEAAFQAARVGIALIDMRTHKGEHARMGALDVMPFIPIKGITIQDCVKLSKQFGKRLAHELQIPVFLYAESAQQLDHVRLPDIRKGEYEGLEQKFKDPQFKPDFGDPVFVPKSGATATGAREILIAYNVNLNTNDKTIAAEISGKIRSSGVPKKDKDGNKIIGPDGKPERIPGRFKGVQAGGMMYNDDIAQVSMNLLNYKEVSLHDAYEAIRDEAKKYDIQVTGSEIVGLVPEDALIQAGKFYTKQQGLSKKFPEKDYVTLAIEHLGLNQLYPFSADKKIIEYIIAEKGVLASMPLNQFLTELASSSPAPGGGSVAALSGALGTALTSMVCNLTIGKEKYQTVEPEIKNILKQSEYLGIKLTELIDKDTDAFNDVMKAFKMPKDTDEQKQKRSQAIQTGYKKAAEIPYETAVTCEKILILAETIAAKGNQSSITDAGVAALMAQAGTHAAILNVQINLGSINDTAFVHHMENALNNLQKKVDLKTREILMKVQNAL
ncbi:MAG: glutamate formimidoyltransferase [Candidatus Thermoplasmatota archaeon]|nr:glutamate formimidoyltransferase [Candidatus Thermoplasmatota archaeon]MBU1941190.1 glutamate formimidoyltransferase [Candidatus Thermoplasmatota archaeon]